MTHNRLLHGTDSVRDLAAHYSDETERPLSGYLMLMGTFIGLFAGFLGLARLTGKRLPPDVQPRDILLLGIATHDLSRIVTRAGVTSPLRAPFTRYQGTSGPPAELAESVRPGRFRHAVGELVTCPFCAGLWVAAFFSYGLVLAPRVTRLIASILTIDAISDNLNLLYGATSEVAKSAPSFRRRAFDRTAAND